MSGASGSAQGYMFVAGLIGCVYGTTTATNVFSTATVTFTFKSSGLINTNSSTLNIENAYSTARLSQNADALILNYSAVKITANNCYWSPETSGVTGSAYGTKVETLEEMQQQATYNGFDFESGNVWKMGTFPELIF